MDNYSWRFLIATHRAGAIFASSCVINRLCSALHRAHDALLATKMGSSSGNQNSLNRPREI